MPWLQMQLGHPSEQELRLSVILVEIPINDWCRRWWLLKRAWTKEEATKETTRPNGGAGGEPGERDHQGP
jgi:hypothetical protein